MEWLFSNGWIKVGIDDRGYFVFNIDPNKVPVEFPGIVVNNVSFKINGIESLGINAGEFNLGGEFTLQDQINNVYFDGDSLLELERPISSKLVKYDNEFNISLIPNKKNRAAKLQISCSNSQWSYDQINNYIFEIANEVLNNISTQYSLPIGFGYFCILHHDMNMFSIVETKAKPLKFSGVMLGPKCNWNLWHLASGNYRKALLSLNPVERFLDLYLAIEGLRSAIKKELKLPYEVDGKIEHCKYNEPKMDKDFSVNTTSKYSQLFGMEFYDILFTSPNGFRQLRNKAAHAVQKNSGIYILNTNLNDYLEYQSAIQYLNNIYIQYLNILVKLNTP